MPARNILTFIILWGLLNAMVVQAEETLDVAIRGGRVVDGTGAPWFVADVGVKDGKIVRLGRIAETEAGLVIDASGLIVAPGFVDMMGQSASPMLEDPKTAINLLTQGITTINAGEGASAAPLNPEQANRKGYSTMAEYFALLDSKGLPVNVVQTVGHTQVRRLVLGDLERRPSKDELAEMQALVREAMRAGAIGVSTALIYPPAVYADTKEIGALAATAGEFGGRYFTHMRNEGDRLLEAIDEALEIGEVGKTPVHIFHLKAAGKQNWGKMPLALARIEQARREGQQVTADIYPYINNGLGIAALIHPRHFAKGDEQLRSRLDDPELRKEIREEMESTTGWENWFRHCGRDWDRVIIGRSNLPKYSAMDGQSVQSMAEANEEDPWDTFFALVKARAFAMPQTMSEANKMAAMKRPFVSYCTDVGPAGRSRSTSHPRGFGAFPRLMSRYVRGFGAIPLETAVSRASAVAANQVFAFDRGRISLGMSADVIVFDDDELTDTADFANPRSLSVGMKHVFVNGVRVLADGKQTDSRPGRVLRGPGYSASETPWNTKSLANPTDERFEAFDQMMSAFLKQHRIPGASVAIADQGDLIFARGYGYADVATGDPVTTQSLFRIASISKPITAVAVLQLVEKDKLQLEDKVFELLDFEEDIATAGDAFDPRCREITIEHLLQHRGGWDRDQSFDAMFQSVRFAEQLKTKAPADATTVIRAMFSQKLDFDPGQRYAYSNFGYNLLGRVIEEVSGQPYEQYVQQHVLKPIGIEQMRIGRTFRELQAENEVRYYHPDLSTSVFAGEVGLPVASPYGGWHLEAMDSHGAWIASATDLAKFAAAFDDPQQCVLLSEASIQLMHGRPEGLAGFDEDGAEKERFYSLGWTNRVVADGKKNHWHSGSLPGTATIMIRRHDGLVLVGLLNSRTSPQGVPVGRELDRFLHRATDASLGR